MTLTWNEFSGHTGNIDEAIVEDLGPVQDALYFKALERAAIVRELTRFKEYVLYEAIHDENMLRNAMAKANHPHLVVAVFGNKKVGLVRAGMSYLLPGHRGYGLGPEMMVQLFCLSTPETWKRFAAESHFTRFGLPMMRKTYALLLERGLL